MDDDPSSAPSAPEALVSAEPISTEDMKDDIGAEDAELGDEAPASALQEAVPVVDPRNLNAGGGWESGMFECLKDEESCWWAFWCSCLVFSRTHDSMGIMKSGRSLGIFIIWLAACGLISLLISGPALRNFIYVIILSLFALVAHRARLRAQLRQNLGIPGQFAEDFFAHCCCIPCAISQEARQSKSFGRPYKDFGTGDDVTIETVTPPVASQASVCQHCLHLSRCSWILFGVLTLILGLSIIIFHMRETITIYPLVFAIPIIILYFLFWRENREDIPIDSVVKLFVAGFTVAALSAAVIETVLSLLQLVFFSPEEMKQMADGRKVDFIRGNFTRVVIWDFVNSFIIAAGVEEFTKHMIVRGCWLPHPLRSPRAVLIALVTGALGFQTIENMEYVFKAGGADAQGSERLVNELILLAERSALPVHAVCAAIQAHGYIRRDFENVNVSLLQILLPAVILHGTFDFTVFLGTHTAIAYYPNSDPFTVEMVILSLAVAVFLIGVAYMFWALRSQNRRLRGPDAGAGANNDGFEALAGDDDVLESQMQPMPTPAPVQTTFPRFLPERGREESMESI